MARPRTVEDRDLMGRLALVFAESGYEGASLARLAAAAGLQKASLYHRFPQGKAQMADEVLATVDAWIEANVVAVAGADTTVAERLARIGAAFDSLYHGGKQACLLNMLSSPSLQPGPFQARIHGAFDRLIATFAVLAAEAGLPAPEARQRATEAVMLLQGSLVLCRGLGDTAPFRQALAALPRRLTERGRT